MQPLGPCTPAQANPYSLSAYPPTLFSAILSSLTANGISPGAVWVQLCAVISLLTQGLADILWPNGQRAPIGANGLLVGASGSGKSLIFKLLMAIIEEILADAPKDDAFLSAGPLIEDTSPAAIIEHLAEHPYAAICAQEAGTLTSLHNAGPLLAQLLDGSTLRKSRFNTEKVRLVGHRLTMLALLQPVVREKVNLFQFKPGGSGVDNRFLVATAGDSERPFHDVKLPDHLRETYRCRARELLQATSANAQAKPKSLPRMMLSDDARSFLLHVDQEMRNQARSRLSPLTSCAEYVSRHAERVLRLAGSLHLFNQGISAITSDVSIETLRAADEIDRQSIHAVQQLLYTPPVPTQAERDANQLLEGLQRFYAAYGNPYFEISKLRRYAAGFGLTSARVTKALPVVVMWGAAQILTSGNKDLLQLRVPSHPWQPPLISW